MRDWHFIREEIEYVLPIPPNDGKGAPCGAGFQEKPPCDGDRNRQDQDGFITYGCAQPRRLCDEYPVSCRSYCMVKQAKDDFRQYLSDMSLSYDFEDYKKKVNRYVEEHGNSIAIHKLTHNIPLTETDYQELERVLTTELGSKDDYQREYGDTHSEY